MDPKSELVNICQRLASRPLTKTDIMYTTTKFGHQLQSIVKLNCIGGQEYAGHLAGDHKQAERNAAIQAVDANRAAVDALASEPKKSGNQQQRLTPAQLAAKKAKQAEEGYENPAFTPKVQLNSLYMKIIKKFPQKGDTVYTCMNVKGGFQATVGLTGLPGEWATRQWAGHVCSTKQKAEQSAAEQALMQLSTEPELVEEANKPKGGTKKAQGKGSGAGGGKSKGKGGWGGFPDWMWEKAAEAWGGGYGSKKVGPRERIFPEAVTAEVVEWRGKYGFAKPHTEVTHAESKRQDGKIYISVSDIGELESLTPGSTVKFFVYTDGAGLGGEEVTVIS
eukprot:TRINITY_DN26192_c0_g3_i1.p1 TRINITY_DN26192_c0_g3~~TRINITY_DN26192_c0_g3_i1.p1  ORF type:complete len:358 (+),score=68.63 TRINITY_DN26192_c0_g3_i1:70-1074(+)